MATKIRRGATITGIVNLRQIDAASNTPSAYPLSGSPSIQLKFPGETGSVVLDSGASEITITDSAASQISFTMSATKSLTLALGVAAVDCFVTNGSNVDIFEKASVFNIVDPANP